MPFRGILLLHDGNDAAPLTQNAAVPRRIAEHRCQKRHAVARGIPQAFNGFGLNQRHVAQQHERCFRRRIQEGQGLLQRVPGSQLRFLQRVFDVVKPRQSGLNFFGLVPHDHHGLSNVLHGLHRGKHMGNHGTSRQGLQHLR